MTNQLDTTATATLPAQDIASLASALILTSDALMKVRARIAFIGEAFGDGNVEDGLKLSRSAFDMLQEYLAQTVEIAGEAADSTMGDRFRAEDIMDKVAK